MMRPVSSSLARSLSQAGAERGVPAARADIDRLREQLSTGLRINRPSDDPAGFTRARTFGRVEQRLAAHERSVNAAMSWADQTQAELGALADLFAEAHEAALRAANGTSDAEALARQVDGLRAEVVGRLNARHAGEYLFAGTETLSAPLDAAGAVAGGDVSGERVREVAPGVSLTLNIPGADALYVGGAPAPDVLQSLADAIRSGDTDAIRAAADAARAAADHYTTLEARSGQVTARLRAAETTLAAQSVQAGEARAAIEEVDLLEAYGALQQRQAGLEAALRATAETTQQTLLNYL